VIGSADELAPTASVGPLKGHRIMTFRAIIAAVAAVGLVASFAAPTMAAGSGSGTMVSKPKPKKTTKKTSEAPAVISTIKAA
jgi:hypothetical protein